MERGLAVPVRPPQSRLLHLQLRVDGRSKSDLRFFSGQGNFLGYIYVVKRNMDLTLNRRPLLAGERHSNFHIGLAAIVLWQGRYHLHISHPNRARSGQGHILPDT